MGRGGMDEDTRNMLAAGCCCCTLIASVTMFACSFATLNPHEIGLHYNGVTFFVEDGETYDNGRYFLGLGHGFHVYPRKLQYVEFSDSSEGGARNQPISVWSKDGQSILMEIGFYFQIMPSKLSDLFFLHRDEYLSVIEDIAMDVFRNVATDHDTIDFFVNRTVVNDAMQTELNKVLKERVFVEVGRFNLLQVDMPDRFEVAVEEKVVAQQTKNILEFRQESAVIRQTIEVINSRADRDIAIIMAESQFNGTVIEKTAEAQAFQKLSKEFATQRAALATNLGFVNATNNHDNDPNTHDYTQLLRYIWLDIVSGRSAKGEVMVGVDSVLLNT